MGTRAKNVEGSKNGSKNTGPKQDTPGRPKASSSRQQTQPDQGTQAGSPTIDAASARRSGKKASAAPEDNYSDRPTDDGKHGDGHQEPNAGFPSRGE